MADRVPDHQCETCGVTLRGTKDKKSMSEKRRKHWNSLHCERIRRIPLRMRCRCFRCGVILQRCKNPVSHNRRMSDHQASKKCRAAFEGK